MITPCRKVQHRIGAMRSPEVITYPKIARQQRDVEEGRAGQPVQDGNH